MKAIQIILSSFIAISLLASCVPSDPQVLSPEEQAAEQARRARRGDKNDNSDKTCAPNRDPKWVAAPKNVEIPMAVLVEARHEQAVQVLKQALNLVGQNEQVRDEGCIRTELTENDQSVLLYQIQYQECLMSSGGKESVFSGSAQMKIQVLENGEIQSISFSTPKLDDTSSGSLSTKMHYQMAQDESFLVDDHLELRMSRTEKGVYALEKFESVSRVTQGQDNKLTYFLPMVSQQGVYTVKENGEILTEFRASVDGQGINLAGGKVTFWLEISKKKDSPHYRYESRFNDPEKTKKAKSGSFEITGEMITMVQDSTGPNHEVRKISQAREKSSGVLDGKIFWGLWQLPSCKQ